MESVEDKKDNLDDSEIVSEASGHQIPPQLQTPIDVGDPDQQTSVSTQTHTPQPVQPLSSIEEQDPDKPQIEDLSVKPEQSDQLTRTELDQPIEPESIDQYPKSEEFIENLSKPAPETPSNPLNQANLDPNVIIKEVIREIPIEKIIEKEIIKEVPVERIVEKIVVREIKVLDQDRFNDELRKRALSMLPNALAAKQNKKDIRIKKILEFIQKEKTATSGQIQMHLHLSAMTVFRHTNTLIAQGKIRFEGKRRARTYFSV